jgi:ZIP family zinc transporter
MIEQNVIIFAFGLTLLAGLSTGIGAFIAFFAKSTNTRMLSLALGFSAGVMIYVSFVDIFPASAKLLEYSTGGFAQYITMLAFFAGIAIIMVIDKLVPSTHNPHQPRKVEDIKGGAKKCDGLMRIGVFVALAIAIHNFPEGIATFTSFLVNPRVGIMIAVAVAIHNIPEGISVSMPIYCATGNRRKAFYYSFLSGLSEPLGALIGFALFAPFFSDAVVGALLAAVAGIMVFISLDELIPAAIEYGNHHNFIYGVILGMAVMALSIVLFL